MIRAVVTSVVVLWCWVAGLAAQDLTALARVVPEKSGIEDGWFGRTSLTIGLTQGVPFRVFTLAAPNRLVIDFREADWSGVAVDALLPEPGRIEAVRFGTFRPGWSRLVADLAEPLRAEAVGMQIDPSSGQAILEIELEAVDEAAFLASSGAPSDPEWPQTSMPKPSQTNLTDGFTVVLDPGHGGVDPGAERADVSEKDLMLSFARALREALVRRGVEAILTRNDDVFVALERRVAIAQEVKADAFISLHADNLSQGRARGAAIYTLSDEASDIATDHLAARHNRSDLIAGVDLSGTDDEVAGVLLDLARQETDPRTAALASALAKGMADAGGPMNTRPLRQAGFSVLKSADIPSVLIEVGFLSSDRDYKNLRDPVWRSMMIDGISDAILRWRDSDAARAPLARQ